MENLTETDVLVIGAGPVGLTAANLLAEQGLSVVIVERHSGTSDEPRAISATDETLRVMNQIGIMDNLGPEMLMDTGARYYGRRGQLLAEVHPKSPRIGQPGKSQIDQPIMETLLLDAARKHPLIDVRFNTEAGRITDSRDYADTTLIDHEGRKTVRSKWILACDGGRSPVRSQLGIGLEGSTQTQPWIVVDIVNSSIQPEKFAEFHCNGTRPVVVVPGAKKRRRYEFMLLPGESAEQVTTNEFIKGLIAPFEFVEEQNIRRATVYVAHQRIAATYRQGRTLLVGDAAHLMPPFAGQALNAGVRDAANIAWKIAANVLHNAPETLIDTYEAERRPHARDMIRLSRLIGKVVMSTQPILTAIRDIAIAGSGVVLPSAKRWITEMRFLKQPHHPEGELIKTGYDVPKAAAALVGRSLPQPLVRVKNSPDTPLDTLLGTGWMLLRFMAPGHFTIQALDNPAGAHPVTVKETGTAFADLPAGTSLVVRPDRYIAAATSFTDETSALFDLKRMIPNLPTQVSAGSAELQA